MLQSLRRHAAVLHSPKSAFVEEGRRISVERPLPGQGDIVGILCIKKTDAGFADDVVLHARAGEEFSSLLNEQCGAAENLEGAGEKNSRRHAEHSAAGFLAIAQATS